MSINQETIAAIATPAGKGGIGIIRVSGQQTSLIIQSLCGKKIKPRQAEFARFIDQEDIIDEGLALFFPQPHSFTGEDVAEFHCHGSPIVLDRMLQKILSLGVRLAEPGEFSKRAFLNNKIDLVQAEAIADLIASGSHQAAKAAMNSLQGLFSIKIKELVEDLIKLRMYIEAAIDFSDEEIDFMAEEKLGSQLEMIRSKLTNILTNASQGRLLQEGITAVIIGKPNAGKSSLLNLLAGQESAIVTDIPGTTRDILREYIQLDGIPLHIVDTAGMRNTTDIIEQEGIKRAKNELEKADIILLVVEGPIKYDQNSVEINNINLTELGKPIIVIFNKIDLSNQKPKITINSGITCVNMSAKTGAGLPLLISEIKKQAGNQDPVEGIYTARRRHIDALNRTKKILNNAKEQFEKTGAGELLAEDLRLAQKALSEITGEFTSDDLLGKIFSSFCIGK
jgi:tRNA modification GTPase